MRFTGQARRITGATLRIARGDPAEKLTPLRVFYFLGYGGLAFFLPFVNLYYHAQSLSGTQIGLVYTINSLGALLAAPLWGRLVDRAARPRRLLQFSLLGGVFYISLLSRQTTFPGILLVTIIGSLLAGSIMAMADALTIQRATNSGFGSVRLWGSLGWAIAVVPAGWLVENVGLWTIFPGYVVFFLSAVLAVNFVPRRPLQTGEHRLNSEMSGWAVLREALRKKELIGFTAVMVIFHLTGGSYYPFLILYMNDIGASGTVIGFASTLPALIELPAMLLTDRLLRRFRPGWVLLAWLILSASAKSLILLWPGVPTILLERALAGISFSFYTVGFVHFVNRHAPPGSGATLMAIFSVTLVNLVLMAGSPLAGAVYDALSGYWVVAMAVSGQVVGAVVLFLVIPDKYKKQQDRLTMTEMS